MKLISFRLLSPGCSLALLLILVARVGFAQFAGEVKAKVDWETLMGNQDLLWQQLPTTWDSGSFIGNGAMGTLIYKEPGQNSIHFEVGNSYVHDHRLEIANGNHRLMIGYFLLDPVGDIINSGKDVMRLDLWDAQTNMDIRTSKGEIHLQAVVHAEKMAIVISVKTSGEENGFTWTWHAAQGDSPRQLYYRHHHLEEPKGYIYNPPPVINEQGLIKTCTQPLALNWNTTTAWREIVHGQERILYITTAHSADGKTAEHARQTINDAVSLTYPALIKSHRQWWHRYYPASFISLTDKKIENYYWIQMYKLASATRYDRCLIDNTGPWLTETPWPNAWWNLNVELSYSPVYTANRLELSHSLTQTLFNHVTNLANNVPVKLKGAAGIATSSSSDLVSPLAQNGELGNLTYALYNAWQEYRYSMNKKMAKTQLYPLLRKAVNLYLSLVKTGSDGEFHLPLSYSPEYGVLTEDTNYDLALFRWGCQTLIDLNHKFSIHDPLEDTWAHTLKTLTRFPTDENGLMIGKGQPMEISHRHYSHLLMIYPLHLIHSDTDSTLIRKSLDYWQSKKKALAGYSFTGAASIAATLGDGNQALSYLNGLVNSSRLRPNTMYQEAGPVIETPLSGAASVNEMLLQSWNGRIWIFPAVPDSWKDAVFFHLRAEGAFLVSAKRAAGKTALVCIQSLAGEPCTIRSDIEAPLFSVGSRTIHPLRNADGTYTIKLKKQEQLIIYPSKHPPLNLMLGQVAGNESDRNFFGLK